MEKSIERYTPDIHQGLTHTQVEQRMKDGANNIQNERITKSYQEIFRDNIVTLFNLINAILAGLIIYVGSFKNLLFLGVVLSNLAIGIFQEIRAKRVLDRLSIISESMIQVRRDNNVCDIHIKELVLDDIMMLKTGNQICADAIIKEGKLELNESNVNGESDVVIKTVGDFIYSGSYILSGNAMHR